MTVINLHPVGNGWGDLPLNSRQLDALMDMCRAIAAVANPNDSIGLFVRATSLCNKLARCRG